MSTSLDQIINYYHTKESRYGYKYLLGGTKHFGYYPLEDENISLKQAMINMTDKLGQTLNLPVGSLVLDAGSGEGTTALRIASKFGLRVEGIDLLDFNVERANRRRKESKLEDKVHFNEGDYAHLNFTDKFFDGIYTMETLVHAPDYRKALKEFYRVLKPGGRLVLFEYSMPKAEDMSKREAWVFQTIIEGSAMHSFPSFTHGSFPKILTEAGFKDVRVEDITKRMIPMLRRFWQLGILPYQFIKLFGKQKQYVNATSGVELYKYRDKFRYNIITAKRP